MNTPTHRCRFVDDGLVACVCGFTGTVAASFAHLARHGHVHTFVFYPTGHNTTDGGKNVCDCGAVAPTE